MKFDIENVFSAGAERGKADAVRAIQADMEKILEEGREDPSKVVDRLKEFVRMAPSACVSASTLSADILLAQMSAKSPFPDRLIRAIMFLMGGDKGDQ